MNCEEFKALAGPFALGSLDADEARKARAHLDEPHHDGCLEALRVAEDDLVHLAKQLVPIRPRPEVWLEVDRLVDRRHDARSAPAWVPWLVAVAASIFAFVQWRAVRGLREDVSGLQTTLASAGSTEQRARIECLQLLGNARAQAETQKRALQALQTPGLELVALKGEGNVRALFNAREKSAFIVAQGVVAQADKDYALWIIRGEAKIAAGLLKADSSGMTVLEVDRALLDGPVDALAITLEPSGGGPAPRGPIMYVGSPKKG